MTERRRLLEHDDRQGALFGGEAFAPAGPAPAWKRPAADDASSEVAPARETEADADAAPPLADANRAAPHGFGSGADSMPPFEARADADTAAPRGFEPGVDPAMTGAVDSGTAVPAGSPSPFADEIAELERATEVRAPRSPRAPLAGPTLDDVMSRVWEGLATGLPVACPVCHGEVAPAISGPPHGRCRSCGTMID